MLDQVDTKYNDANDPLMDPADVNDYFEKAKISSSMQATSRKCFRSNMRLKTKPEVLKKEQRQYVNVVNGPVHNGFIEYQAKASKRVLENVSRMTSGELVYVNIIFYSCS